MLCGKFSLETELLIVTAVEYEMRGEFSPKSYVITIVPHRVQLISAVITKSGM